MKCRRQKAEEAGGHRKETKTLYASFHTPQSAARNSSRGQALTEYVVIAGLLMASLGILTVFFVTFKEYGMRILALVSSEYP